MTSTQVPGKWHGTIYCLLLALTLALTFWVAGCGENEIEDPNFQEPPLPETQNWFYGVWASAADDVYVVGQPGLILHYDGSTWTQQASGTTEALIDIYSKDGTIYVCGHNGTILRNSGGSWSKMSSGTSEHLFGIGTYSDTLYVAGINGTARRFSGSAWSASADSVIVRDPSGAPSDTLDRREDIQSLVTVGYYGIGGSGGSILMEDSCPGGDADCIQYNWELRRVRGGSVWVQAGWGDPIIASNFIATNEGQLFQLTDDGQRQSWLEIFSPSTNAVYGMWVTGDPGLYSVYVVTREGEVILEMIEPVPGETLPAATVHLIYDHPFWLTDIWGIDAWNLYAVGINETVLRFHNPAQDPTTPWEVEVIELPELEGLSKSAAIDMPAVDKFGRPF